MEVWEGSMHVICVCKARYLYKVWHPQQLSEKMSQATCDENSNIIIILEA